MWNCWINSKPSITCSTTAISSMIQLRSTAGEKYCVTLTNMNTDTVKDVPSLSLLCFSKGMTQECLYPTLWREVWWTLTVNWCRATRSCQSTVRMSGQPLRRPQQHYSRFVWPSRGSEWQVGSKLCWMTTLKIMFPVLQCCVGPIKMEVGRFKAGPFHSERRLSQSSQVINWDYECWIEIAII